GVHDRARADDPGGPRLRAPRGHAAHHADRLPEHVVHRAGRDGRDRAVDGRAGNRPTDESEVSQAAPAFRREILFVAVAWALASACGRAPVQPPVQRPSILLVTLDTTRFDSIGPDAKDVQTPAFDAIAARGRRYLQAYAAVPETLPSHSSLMTGL